MISIEGENERARQFYSQFVENCDRKGTNLSDYFRKQMQDAMVCGVSYTLVDFPRVEGKVCSRAAEDELGS